MKANEYYIMPMTEFVNDEISPLDMSKLIGDVMYEYAVDKLEKCGDGPGKQCASNLYYLRRLRDVFQKMEPV
jgi:hypothetical protein